MEEEIMSIKEIQDGLEDKRLYRVSRKTGVSYPTLMKLSKGLDLNYTTDILKAVSAYLSKK